MVFLAWALVFIGATTAFAEGPEDDPNLVERAVSSSLSRLEDYRSDLHEWDKSVRGFRRDHNFTLSSGVTTSLWHFKHFGAIENQTVPASGTYVRFQYSFHLPLYHGFGYFLGSSAGSTVNESTREDGFHAPLMVSLPGVLVGFVWNASPAVRFVVGLDLFLERLERIRFNDPESAEDNPTISITARSAAVHVACDFYVKLRWAIRTEAAWRGFRTVRPRNAQSYGTNIMIEKEESALGLGLAYHFI